LKDSRPVFADSDLRNPSKAVFSGPESLEPSKVALVDSDTLKNSRPIFTDSDLRNPSKAVFPGSQSPERSRPAFADSKPLQRSKARFTESLGVNASAVVAVVSSFAGFAEFSSAGDLPPGAISGNAASSSFTAVPFIAAVVVIIGISIAGLLWFIRNRLIGSSDETEIEANTASDGYSTVFDPGGGCDNVLTHDGQEEDDMWVDEDEAPGTIARPRLDRPLHCPAHRRPAVSPMEGNCPG
jgi:hypothetical protein